jgi:hypothetical protein
MQATAAIDREERRALAARNPVLERIRINHILVTGPGSSDWLVTRCPACRSRGRWTNLHLWTWADGLVAAACAEGCSSGEICAGLSVPERWLLPLVKVGPEAERSIEERREWLRREVPRLERRLARRLGVGLGARRS